MARTTESGPASKPIARRHFLRSGIALAAVAGSGGLALPGFAQKAAAVPLRVQLNWMRSVEYAGIWTALEKGYYDEAHLDVAIRDWSATIEPSQAVVTGLAAIGLVSNGLTLATARANGLPVKAIGSFFQKSAAGLLSKADRNIVKPQDLVGKTVGIPQTGRVTWDIFSAANDLKGKVTIRVVGFDLTPLLTDQVDAFLGFSTSQPFTLATQGVKSNFMFFADYSAPRYDDVIFTTDDQLASNGDAIVAWLGATRRGWEYAFANRQEIAELTVKKYATNLAVEQQVAILNEQARLMQPASGNSRDLFRMDPAVWQRGFDLMKQLELLPTTFQSADLVTAAPLDKLDRA